MEILTCGSLEKTIQFPVACMIRIIRLRSCYGSRPHFAGFFGRQIGYMFHTRYGRTAKRVNSYDKTSIILFPYAHAFQRHAKAFILGIQKFHILRLLRLPGEYHYINRWGSPRLPMSDTPFFFTQRKVLYIGLL